MARNLKQLLAQIDRLQQQADALKQRERAGVIGRIQEAIAHYGLTADELFVKASGKSQAVPAKTTRRTKTAKATAKAASVPKYQDGTGRTWTGRGKRPGWFIAALADGKTSESMLINQ